jgi:RNA polymerase sigma factor (sigma-70 family)
VEDQGHTQILFGKAASGDRAAFDDLAGRYRGRLEARIRSQLRSLQGTIDVEDILQETLAQAFGSIGGFRWQGEGSFPAWLSGIAKNVVLKAIRRSRRHRTLEIPPDLQGEATSPSRALRRDERFHRLQAAIDRLSGDHREVIRLARIEGLPIKAIAGRMERSPDAVKQLLSRALKELRRSFGDTESVHLPDRRLEMEEGADGSHAR